MPHDIWLAAIIALPCLVILGALAWAREPVCPACPHCQRRLEERIAARRRYDHDQRLLHHEMMHKGMGFREDDPDRYKCEDKDCPRNRRS